MVRKPRRSEPKQPLLTFLRRLLREFVRDNCLVRASGLAFASLIALVPLSALLFSLFSAVGSFTDLIDSLQSFLIRQLVPTHDCKNKALVHARFSFDMIIILRIALW